MTQRMIALAGGIGSGKSTAGQLLRDMGYPVLDTDGISRQMTQPGSPVLGRIAEAFGEEVLNPDGSLNRKALAGIVFADREKRMELNRITHPAIAESLFAQARACGRRLCFAEVPLITEPGFADRFDEIWLVSAPRALRIERATGRDGCTAEEIERRMAGQPTEREMREISCAVLDNSGSLERLKAQIAAQLRRLGEEIDRE